MRASTVIPGAAEGVAPPDAEPVTIHEAMEVLADQVCLSVCQCEACIHLLYVGNECVQQQLYNLLICLTGSWLVYTCVLLKAGLGINIDV